MTHIQHINSKTIFSNQAINEGLRIMTDNDINIDDSISYLNCIMVVYKFKTDNAICPTMAAAIIEDMLSNVFEDDDASVVSEALWDAFNDDKYPLG